MKTLVFGRYFFEFFLEGAGTVDWRLFSLNTLMGCLFEPLIDAGFHWLFWSVVCWNRWLTLIRADYFDELSVWTVDWRWFALITLMGCVLEPLIYADFHWLLWCAVCWNCWLTLIFTDYFDGLSVRTVDWRSFSLNTLMGCLFEPLIDADSRWLLWKHIWGLRTLYFSLVEIIHYAFSEISENQRQSMVRKYAEQSLPWAKVFLRPSIREAFVL